MPEDGVAQQRFLGREYKTKARVQGDGRHEAEEPVEGVKVLGAGADVSSGRVDRVSQTGQVGADGSEEGDGGSPVEAADVAVPPVRIVEGGDVDVLPLDYPIV